jgi:hypothetical protein
MITANRILRTPKKYFSLDIVKDCKPENKEKAVILASQHIKDANNHWAITHLMPGVKSSTAHTVKSISEPVRGQGILQSDQVVDLLVKINEAVNKNIGASSYVENIGKAYFSRGLDCKADRLKELDKDVKAGLSIEKIAEKIAEKIVEYPKDTILKGVRGKISNRTHGTITAPIFNIARCGIESPPLIGAIFSASIAIPTTIIHPIAVSLAEIPTRIKANREIKHFEQAIKEKEFEKKNSEDEKIPNIQYNSPEVLKRHNLLPQYSEKYFPLVPQTTPTLKFEEEDKKIPIHAS